MPDARQSSGPRPAPGFDRFVAELREEIAWLGQIHANDNTGQSASDVLSLARLIKHVKAVQESLGY
jgi:hypothetical protein